MVDHELLALTDHAVAVTTFALGDVHGEVGPLEPLHGALPGAPVERDADAGAGAHLTAGQEERVGARGHNAVSDLQSFGFRDVLEYQDELVPRQPGQGVTWAHPPEQPIRDRRQQLVADAVTVHIVDPLELVEVAEQYR